MQRYQTGFSWLYDLNSVCFFYYPMLREQSNCSTTYRECGGVLASTSLGLQMGIAISMIAEVSDCVHSSHLVADYRQFGLRHGKGSRFALECISGAPVTTIFQIVGPFLGRSTGAKRGNIHLFR